MRSLIRFLSGCLIAFAMTGAVTQAHSPTVTQLDATARAAGNRRDVAERIGEAIFAKLWPAEVTQIAANELNGHLIVGVRVLGVKFHRSLSREEFADEVVSLVQAAFAAAPSAEEVDLWATVPIDVAKGVVVSGDLAKPTSRTVFSVSVHRGESASSLQARVLGAAGGVYWDSLWSRTALVES